MSFIKASILICYIGPDAFAKNSPEQDGILIFPLAYISVGLKLSVRQSSSLSIIMHTFSAF